MPETTLKILDTLSKKLVVKMKIIYLLLTPAINLFGLFRADACQIYLFRF